MNNVQKRILKDAERRIEHAGQSYRDAKKRAEESGHKRHITERLLYHYQQTLDMAKEELAALKAAFEGGK